MPTQKTQREEREGRPALRLLFLYVFPPPLGLPCVNWDIFPPPPGLPCVSWDSQECHLFYLGASLWSSDLHLFCFCWIFPCLSFSHCHSGLFSYFNYLMITMLYIIHFVTESLYPFTNISPSPHNHLPHPAPASPWQPPFYSLFP